MHACALAFLISLGGACILPSAWYRLLDEAYEFNQDLSSWDTSSVTDMAQAFQFGRSFNQDVRLTRLLNAASSKRVLCGHLDTLNELTAPILLFCRLSCGVCTFSLVD